MLRWPYSCCLQWLCQCVSFFFQWFQGYFRKAEVQASAGQYDTSLLLYGRALQLQPNDISILNAAKRIAQLSNVDTQCKWWTLFEACANFQLERELYFICISVEKRVPWIGIGAGAVFGMIIVILDIFFTKKPTLSVREDTPQFIQMSQFIFQWTIRFSFSSIRFWWF